MLASQGLAELFNNMVSVNSCISFNFCDYLEFRTRGENSISESVHVGAYYINWNFTQNILQLSIYKHNFLMRDLAEGRC